MIAFKIIFYGIVVLSCIGMSAALFSRVDWHLAISHLDYFQQTTAFGAFATAMFALECIDRLLKSVIEALEP